MGSLAASEFEAVVRTLAGLVFLTASIGKMRHLTIFGGVVANYRLLPESLEAPIAYALPPLEGILGVALLAGIASFWTQAVAALLLVVFACAIGINLRRGRTHIDCGCFQSTLKQPLTWSLVLRNIVLALMLGVAALFVEGTRNLAATLDGVLAGAVLFVILQSLSILWSIVPAWRVRDVQGASR